MFKNNPNYEIKEISEKYKEIVYQIKSNLNKNMNYEEVLSKSLTDLMKNKTDEENKINEFYSNLEELILKKKKELIDKLNKIFVDNSQKIELELNSIRNKISKTEKLKINVESNINHINKFIDNFEYYLNLLNETKDHNTTNIKFNLTIFSFENHDKLISLLCNNGELKSISKILFNNNTSIIKDYFIEKINNQKERKKYENISTNNNNSKLISNNYIPIKIFKENLHSNLLTKDSSYNQSISLNNYSSISSKPETKKIKSNFVNTQDYLINNSNKLSNNLNISKRKSYMINSVSNYKVNDLSQYSLDSKGMINVSKSYQKTNKFVSNNKLELNRVKLGVSDYKLENDYNNKSNLGTIENKGNTIQNLIANNKQSSINDFVDNKLQKYSNPIIDLKYEKIMSIHKSINQKKILASNFKEKKNSPNSPCNIIDKSNIN